MDNQNQPQGTNDIEQPSFSKIKTFLSANKFAIIFIMVLSLMSFSATGYLLTANKNAPAQNRIPQENFIAAFSPTPSPQTTMSNAPLSEASVIALADETATWSAFTSQKYSYSLKYPIGWSAQITAQSDPKILEYVAFNPTATKAGTLSITLSYGARTYLEALALDSQIGENITIASVGATKKNSKDSSGNEAVNIIVPDGVNSIIFNAKNAYSDLFSQMLSTLKLTK